MNTLTSTTFFSEYEKTFLYCRTKIDISLHFAPPPLSSSMTKFCLLKIVVPKANPFFVTYCFSNAFLCQGEEAGFMKAMLWGGWVLFYCTHSICHKQSLSWYHLFPLLPFLTKGFLMVTTCVTYLFVSKGTGDSQHINLVKNGPFPNSSSFIMCPSGPPSSPLLSIFCLGRRTLSTSFKSLLRYRQILQWSPWSSRAPNTQFGLIQTVTYWLDNVYGINNEGTMKKWRLALTKKEV